MTEARIMRGPRQFTTQKGRYYVWKKNRYWSVTTIIGGGLPKPVLVNWAKKFTAEYAVENLDQLYALAKKEPAGAVDWLKRAADRSRDTAGNLGSLVHDAAEAYALGQPYPEWTAEQAPFMESFKAWLADFSPRFEAVEAPCYSDKHRYAGTLDGICVIDGVRYLIDYKTGRTGPWPEAGLQLAAYRYSESFIGLPDGSKEPTPPVDACAVVKLRPEGYEFVPVRADEEVFRAFLYVREVFRFTQELSKDIVGMPLDRPERDPIDAIADELIHEGVS
jgi:hypothetical protein